MSNGLEAVFLNNRSVLLRFLRARGAADTAEDLLHELWFRAVRKSSDPIADPLAYLFRAAAPGAAPPARDLLHELWFRAVRKSSDPSADPLAYLFRTADNLIVDRHRRF